MTSSIDDLRQQLQQLQSRHERGELTAEAFAEARAPLERELVALVVAGTPPTTPTATAAPGGQVPEAALRRPSGKLVATVLAGIVVLAASGYGLTGSPRLGLLGSAQGGAPATAAAGGAAAGSPTAPPTEEQVREMVDRLAARLQEQPDDVVGQTMLARAYTVMGRNDEAIVAFRKALSLSGEDAGLMADLADALAASKNGDLSGEPTQLIERALAAEPGNLKALALSGSAAFDRRDYVTAVRQWEQVGRALPPDSGFSQQVNSSIAQARQLGGMPAAAPIAAATGTDGSPAPGEATNAASAASAISGTVALSPTLQAKADPDDTVFVVARAASGPRMPLAVLRKQVKDLPLSFKLDDSMAMAPTAKISDHPQVIVIARISKSGNAMPQAGDIGGQSAAVTPGTTGIVVELNEVLSGEAAR